MYLSKHWYGVVLCVIAMAIAPAAMAAGGSAAEQVLFEKAKYWSDNGNPEEAVKFLNKILLSNPDNARARVELIRLESIRGNDAKASQQLDQLKLRHPDHPAIAELEANIAGGYGHGDTLARARELAKQGNTRESVTAYQAYFGDKPQPGPLALEYYQVASALPENREGVTQGLRELVRAYPDNVKYKLELARQLINQEPTRIEGIHLLAEISDSSVKSEAVPMWKQSLGWLPVMKSSIPEYQAYQKRIGNDEDIARLIKDAKKPHMSASARQRQSAFVQMKRGELSKAEKGFRKLIRNNRNDADAHAGLGMLLLREKRYSEAANHLDEAIRLSPRKVGEWGKPRDMARYNAIVAVAGKDASEGRLDAAVARLQRAMALFPDKRGDLTLQMARIQSGRSQIDGLNSALQLLQQYPDRKESAEVFIQVYESGEQNDRSRHMLDQAIDILEQAVFNHMDKNWVRLNLARLYQARHENDRAVSILDGLLRSNPDMAEAHYARALFMADVKDWQQAQRSMLAIPAASRTAEMQYMARLIEVNDAMQRARALHGKGHTRNAVKILDAQSRQIDQVSIYPVANGWMAIGQPQRALDVAYRYLKTRPKNDFGIRIFYMSLLSAAGERAELDIWLRNMADKREQMNSADQAELDRLVRGNAIRTSDALRQQGQYAQAW